ncbi:hypothetical protein DLM76_10070 [Leptospira yasudae]|uniref:Uncharacterized protein n=1 Tax=Leptospira yasudae TaxID=2202201 RepID=A0ABX9M4V9_9LEPT|nr:hypothetical protein DLM77_07695 [Leptospira yasudae]RHX94417.1 hypothetical protein DLM76_10070 [Leptospira yasudae]
MIILFVQDMGGPRISSKQTNAIKDSESAFDPVKIEFPISQKKKLNRSETGFFITVISKSKIIF